MKKVSLLLLALGVLGCAAVPVSQESIASLKEKHKLQENFIEVNNCFINGLPTYGKSLAGICGLTNSELVILVSEKGKGISESNSKSVKFSEMEKIGYKSKVRLHQFQLTTKQGFFVITMSPNKQLADGELTKKWYSYIVIKGVKEFTPESYLEPIQTYYQIRYQ